MLSKSKGQILRVAAALHVFFEDEINADGTYAVKEVGKTLSGNAINAAKNFVETCCQHAAFIAGRGDVDEEIKSLTAGECFILIDIC